MTSIFVFCWPRHYVRGSKPSRVTGSGEAKKAAGGQHSYEISAEKVKVPSKQARKYHELTT
jgi:hypothetical protein